MYGNTNHQKISTEALMHYFDGIEKQRLEAGALSRKSGQWLAMREKLMKLPEPAFEVVMRSLSGMIDSILIDDIKDEGSKNVKKQQEKAQAQALFERVMEAEAIKGGVSSTNAAAKISKI